MAFVYMLRCADDSLYTGWTSDLAKRFLMHSAGKASKCTRARLPVKMVYFEECTDKSSALKRELAIKKLTRGHKELLIEAFKQY